MGQEVDVWREPSRKDLSGWRGPCRISEPTGDGQVTVAWQGSTLTAPVSRVQPHIPLIGFVTHCMFESDFGEEADDSQPLLHEDTSIDPLMLMAERMSPGGSLLHCKRLDTYSADAIRDRQLVCNLGFKATVRFDIHQYLGVRMGRGVPIFTAISGVRLQHLVWWPLVTVTNTS